jgi:hypothetical protein
MARASRSGLRKSPQAPSKSSQGLRYQKSHIVPNIGTMELRLQISSLMNELVSAAEREPAIDSTLRGSLKDLQLKLQFALATGALSAQPLPTVAPELFVDRQNKKETPPEFIARVYAPWLPDKLSSNVLRRLDFSLYSLYHQWKSLGAPMPPGFVLKTKKQLNDELLRQRGFTSGELDPQTREAVRLHRLARHRRSRQPK